jgi:hypothetical protein
MRKLTSRRILAIDDGEYRVFVSVYCRGQRLSFGFPKDNCLNQMVWVGRDDEHVCWLSLSDARANLGSLFRSQCVPVLEQCGQCGHVTSLLITPVVMAKRLLGTYQKVEISGPSSRKNLWKRPARPVRPRESQEGAKWRPAEENRLRKEFAAGRSVAQIASEHGRTEIAIKSRLVKIGLLDRSSLPFD